MTIEVKLPRYYLTEDQIREVLWWLTEEELVPVLEQNQRGELGGVSFYFRQPSYRLEIDYDVLGNDPFKS